MVKRFVFLRFFGFLVTILKNISNDAETCLRWENMCSPGNVLFKYVVLNGAMKGGGRYTIFLGYNGIERQ